MSPAALHYLFSYPLLAHTIFIRGQRDGVVERPLAEFVNGKKRHKTQTLLRCTSLRCASRQCVVNLYGPAFVHPFSSVRRWRQRMQRRIYQLGFTKVSCCCRRLHWRFSDDCNRKSDDTETPAGKISTRMAIKPERSGKRKKIAWPDNHDDGNVGRMRLLLLLLLPLQL